MTGTHVTRILGLPSDPSFTGPARVYFKPPVSFMLQVVICDTHVLLALEGFPLEAKESPESERTGLLRSPLIPAPASGAALGSPRWANFTTWPPFCP